MAYDNKEIRESEYNELAFKIARINKLQDKCNTLWQSPKGIWFNQEIQNGGPEYGFVLIASNLLQLYKEVRPKCTPDEKEEMDTLKEEINKFTELGQEAIHKKGINRDSFFYKYDPNKWIKIKELLDKFENKVRDLLDAHGFNPDKNAVQGL